jgi:hypothetical protein
MRAYFVLAVAVLIAIPLFQNCSGAVFSGGSSASTQASAPAAVSPGSPVSSQPTIPSAPVVAASPTPAPTYFSCGSGAPDPQLYNVTDSTLLSSLGTGNKIVTAKTITLPADPAGDTTGTMFYLFSGGKLIQQSESFSFDSQLGTLSSGVPICVIRTDGAPNGVTLPSGAPFDIGCAQRASDGTAGLDVAEVSFEYNSAQVVSFLMCLNTGDPDTSAVTVGDLKTVFGSGLSVE